MCSTVETNQKQQQQRQRQRQQQENLRPVAIACQVPFCSPTPRLAWSVPPRPQLLTLQHHHSRATNRPWRWTLKHNKLKFSPTKIAMLTSSVPVWKHQKKSQRERGKKAKSKRLPIAGRETTWRTRVFRARSSFGSLVLLVSLLRHMILPNLICRSGPRALIMWLLAICHSCWTASKEASRASERTERSQRRQKISEHLIPFTYLNLIEIKF